MATATQISRLVRDFEQIAREPIRVEEIGGTFYGYCFSELGALRLEHKYNNPHCRAAYSENLKTWYFSIDPAAGRS